MIFKICIQQQRWTHSDKGEEDYCHEIEEKSLMETKVTYFRSIWIVSSKGGSSPIPPP